MRKKRQQKKLIKKEETFLRNLFHEWDPILTGSTLHSPIDEYDSYIHQIISSLHRDNNYQSVKVLLEPWCSFVPKSQVEQVADKVWQWWKQKRELNS